MARVLKLRNGRPVPGQRFPLYERGVACNRFVEPTGEFRPPQHGEIYLSGADIEGYVAPMRLTTCFWIARECEPPPPAIVRDGYRYVLEGPDDE